MVEAVSSKTPAGPYSYSEFTGGPSYRLATGKIKRKSRSHFNGETSKNDEGSIFSENTVIRVLDFGPVDASEKKGNKFAETPTKESPLYQQTKFSSTPPSDKPNPRLDRFKHTPNKNSVGKPSKFADTPQMDSTERKPDKFQTTPVNSNEQKRSKFALTPELDSANKKRDKFKSTPTNDDEHKGDKFSNTPVMYSEESLLRTPDSTARVFITPVPNVLKWNKGNAQILNETTQDGIRRLAEQYNALVEKERLARELKKLVQKELVPAALERQIQLNMLEKKKKQTAKIAKELKTTVEKRTNAIITPKIKQVDKGQLWYEEFMRISDDEGNATAPNTALQRAEVFADNLDEKMSEDEKQKVRTQSQQLVGKKQALLALLLVDQVRIQKHQQHTGYFSFLLNFWSKIQYSSTSINRKVNLIEQDRLTGNKITKADEWNKFVDDVKINTMTLHCGRRFFRAGKSKSTKKFIQQADSFKVKLTVS